MTDDRLRSAAGLLYQRLEVATDGRWRDGGRPYNSVVSDAQPHDDGYDGRLVGESMWPGDREYVVTMQPAVGQALADLLAYLGSDSERTGEMWRLVDAVADALLDASRDAMPGDPLAHLDNLR